MEEIKSSETAHDKAYASAYQSMLEQGLSDFIELEPGVPKVEFLKWLVTKKGLLLHGSNNKEINILEPRQANCTAKEFGNLKAVYGVEDSVLPTFYAIKDLEKFRGRARSGFTETDEDGSIKREYEFAIDKDLVDQAPWSEGVVYLLPRETFVQGHDDEGEPIDEWASTDEVIPLGKLRIAPEDFPYFDEIGVIEEDN